MLLIFVPSPPLSFVPSLCPGRNMPNKAPSKMHTNVMRDSAIAFISHLARNATAAARPTQPTKQPDKPRQGVQIIARIRRMHPWSSVNRGSASSGDFRTVSLRRRRQLPVSLPAMFADRGSSSRAGGLPHSMLRHPPRFRRHQLIWRVPL